MASGTSAAPAKASDPPEWYESLTPEDKLAYWKARDDYNKAAEGYRAAVEKAEEDKAKTLQVHEEARKAWRTAKDALAKAVAEADEKRQALSTKALEYDSKKVLDAEIAAAKAKQQGDDLQALLDAYKKALDSLVAARGEADSKRKILAAASEPFEDPEKAEIKAATRLQAETQFAMDKAKADIPREAARDVFAVKKTELQARIPREKRGALVSSAPAD
jgi:hypothetical protein